MPRVILTNAYDANSNRTSLTSTIAGTNDFKNTYTFDTLNRLTRQDQTGNSGAVVAEKRIDFTYNKLNQFASITRYKAVAGGTANEGVRYAAKYSSNLGGLGGIRLRRIASRRCGTGADPEQ